MTAPAETAKPQGILTPLLVAACVVLLLSFAVRASFGVFQIPIANEFGWPRAEFSLAIAVQNLAWGFGQPVFSAIGDRFGNRLAIVLGAFVYAAGLVLSAYGTTATELQLYNILIGCGVAGTGFGVIVAVVGRAAAPEHRSMSLAIATAAGSAGQVIGPPFAGFMLDYMDWSGVFVLYAAIILATLSLLPFLRHDEPATQAELEQTMASVLGRALKDPNYLLIFVGFFSCGYQLGFMTAHLPAFITEMCGPIEAGGLLAGLGIDSTSRLGAVALGLVGLANIAGTLVAGKLGGHYPKKYLLSLVYTGRTLVAAAFILVPITPLTVVLFSLSMGALWLATVPLTSGLIAHIYGLRYMGTLYAIVFLSHQIGGFLGVWMGGRLYDLNGSYDLVWWIGVGVGAFSAIVHLPIREVRTGLAPA